MFSIYVSAYNTQKNGDIKNLETFIKDFNEADALKAFGEFEAYKSKPIARNLCGLGYSENEGGGCLVKLTWSGLGGMILGTIKHVFAPHPTDYYHPLYDVLREQSRRMHEGCSDEEGREDEIDW